MYGNEIKQIIKEYLRNDKVEYAIMIDGEWGSGKTYFLTHSLIDVIQDIQDKKEEKRKYAYVSLYGVKSIEEVAREIIFHCLGKKNKDKVEKTNSFLGAAGNILSASVGMLNFDLSKVQELLTNVSVKNWIICFDDLERCSLPINEILGFINRLVEHNHCKVIVLANEKEIGALNLNQRLEEKYQVVLSGMKLKINKEDDNIFDINTLKENTKQLFDEDIVYKSIKEKVIGLCITYEPNMKEAYNSIICNYDEEGFREFLEDNREKILSFFDNQECKNLRTLIITMEMIKKIYNEIMKYGYYNKKYYKKIMDEFVKYIVYFTIYYRQGGKVSDLKLTEEIGFIPLGNSIFSNIRGFKFLEKYCTTLSFSEEDFNNIFCRLENEYEQEEKELQKRKNRSGEACDKLTYWWELEDNEVNELIKTLKNEIQENKYYFNSYQMIIGLLLILKENKFEVGDLDKVISDMNQNIEKYDGKIDIEKISYTFQDQIQLKKYNELINKLKLKAKNKNQIIDKNEISAYFKSEDWAKKLLDYCDKNYNKFVMRYAFIDLLDIDQLCEKVKGASPKEIYIVKDTFEVIYKASNINQFFLGDMEKIKEFRSMIEKIKLDGINKPKALKVLKVYLDDIIQRLEK